MSEYKVYNILDLVENAGEEFVKNLLSTFSCPKNPNVEHFIKENALDFSIQSKSITFVVMDEENDIVGAFALTHKAIEMNKEGISNTTKKNIEKYAKEDPDDHKYHISAFLIAQFARNFAFEEKKIDGPTLMDLALDQLKAIRREIGGGVVYIDCEDEPKLLNFYQDKIGFRAFSDRFSEIDQILYHQLFRFL